MSVEGTPSVAPAVEAPAQGAPVAAEPAKAPDDVSSKSALAVLRDIRKQRKADRKGLALAPSKQEPDNAMEIDPALLEGADIDPDEATETDLEATETETESDQDPDVEPPDAEKPTWAQKLRTDLAAKTERLKTIEAKAAEREQRFEQVARQVEHRIEDVKADVEAERAYSKALEAAIAKAGFSVPADWKRAFAAEHRAKVLERQLARGQEGTQAQQNAKAAGAAQQKVRALGQQFPEMDFAKDADGKAWLQARFSKGGKGMKDLDADALTFVKALRYDRSQKATQRNPQSQQQPRPKPAPTLAGQKANAGAKRAPSVPQNEKESAAWLAARRTARG